MTWYHVISVPAERKFGFRTASCGREERQGILGNDRHFVDFASIQHRMAATAVVIVNCSPTLQDEALDSDISPGCRTPRTSRLFACHNPVTKN